MATRPPSPEEQGKRSVEELAASARDCTACDLYKTGTQTVFGEGGPESKLMFVGEQPGDQEDKAGHPFVGPAGRMLDKALEAEIAALKPRVIVCLGATAAQALLGRAFRVTQQRGEWVESPLAPRVMATIHPSAILRARTTTAASASTRAWSRTSGR